MKPDLAGRRCRGAQGLEPAARTDDSIASLCQRRCPPTHSGSVADVKAGLERVGYPASPRLAGRYCSSSASRFCWSRGAPRARAGRAAKAISRATERLIRLQCYEGLDRRSRCTASGTTANASAHPKRRVTRPARPGTTSRRRTSSTRPLLEAIASTEPWCCSSTRSTRPTRSSRRCSSGALGLRPRSRARRDRGGHRDRRPHLQQLA